MKYKDVTILQTITTPDKIVHKIELSDEGLMIPVLIEISSGTDYYSGRCITEGRLYYYQISWDILERIHNKLQEKENV